MLLLSSFLVVFPLAFAKAPSCADPRTAWPPAQLRAGAGPSARREILETGDHASAFLPVFSTHPLSSPSTSSASTTNSTFLRVTRALVLVHGVGGNADFYFKQGVDFISNSSGVDESVLLIAPWFGDESVTRKLWLENSSTSTSSQRSSQNRKNAQRSTCWNKSGSWTSGGDDSISALASFSLLDLLVQQLRGRFNQLFPNLQHVTVSGFSAGCQATSRWAFFSPHAMIMNPPKSFYGTMGVLQDDESAVGANSMVAVRIVSADCGSYMYFDGRRPHSSCVPLYNTGTSHWCGNFSVPEPANITACPDYDHYKYGLSLTQGHEHLSYLRRFADPSSGEKLLNETRQDWIKKDFRLLLGKADVCQCNVHGYKNEPEYCSHSDLPQQCEPSVAPHHGCCDTWPDSHRNAADATCPAMMGGSNRLQRGLNWLAHINHTYSDYQPRYAFFDGGHDVKAMGRSSVFQEWALLKKEEGHVARMRGAVGTLAGEKDVVYV